MAQKRPFLPQNMFSWADIGLAGSFGALLAGWLVVVARGLCLARHLFTLVNCLLFENKCCKVNQRDAAGGGHSAKVRWHRYSKE